MNRFTPRRGMLLATSRDQNYDWLQAFAANRVELADLVPEIPANLKPDNPRWISFPVYAELATHFHLRFPVFLGLQSWPRAFFAAFNLFWISDWALSLAGLWFGMRVAFFPTWFQAIGGAAKGLEHLSLALIAGGDFPGLWTSPMIGAASYLQLSGLVSSTHPAASLEGKKVSN